MLDFAYHLREFNVLSGLKNKTIFSKYLLFVFLGHKINEFLSFFFVLRRRNYSYWIVNWDINRHIGDYFDSFGLCSLCIGYIYKTCIYISSFHVYKYLLDIFSKYHFIFQLSPQTSISKCK